jgi:uncharacterized protein YjbI with pentapeptide repeats
MTGTNLYGVNFTLAYLKDASMENSNTADAIFAATVLTDGTVSE